MRKIYGKLFAFVLIIGILTGSSAPVFLRAQESDPGEGDPETPVYELTFNNGLMPIIVHEDSKGDVINLSDYFSYSPNDAEASLKFIIKEGKRPSHGTLTQKEDEENPGEYIPGVYIYIPDANWDQTDSFTITAYVSVNGEEKISTDGEFKIKIDQLNDDAPKAKELMDEKNIPAGPVDAIYGEYVDIAMSTLLSYFEAVDHELKDGEYVPLDLIASVADPDHGRIEIIKDAEEKPTHIRYFVDPRYPGTNIIEFSVRHVGESETATGAVNVTVKPAFNKPILSNTTATGATADITSGILTGLRGIYEDEVTPEKPIILEVDITDYDAALAFNADILDDSVLSSLDIKVTSDNEKILKNANIKTVITPTSDPNTVHVKITITGFEENANTSPSESYGSLNITLTAIDLSHQPEEPATTKEVPVTITFVNDAPIVRYIRDSENNLITALTMKEDTETAFFFELYDVDMYLYEGKPTSGYTFQALSNNHSVFENSMAAGPDINIEFVKMIDESINNALYRVTLKPKKDANTQQAKYSPDYSPVTITLDVLGIDGISAVYDGPNSVAVTVTQVNDDPVVENFERTVGENETISFHVTALASDVDDSTPGETLVFDTEGATCDAESGECWFPTTQGGKIWISADGKTLTYVPEKYFYSDTKVAGKPPDTFTYKVTDSLVSKPGTGTINVDYINYDPSFPDLVGSTTKVYKTLEDFGGKPYYDVVFQVFDPEEWLKNPENNDPDEGLAKLMLQVISVTNRDLIGRYDILEAGDMVKWFAEHGAEYSYTDEHGVEQIYDRYYSNVRVIRVYPAADRNSFGGKNVRFQIRASDGDGNTDAYFELYIEPVNDAPVAGNPHIIFDEDTEITVYAADILNSCSDIDKTLGEGDKLYLIRIGDPVTGAIAGAEPEEIHEIVVPGEGKITDIIYDTDYTTDPKGIRYIVSFRVVPDPDIADTFDARYGIRDIKGETASGLFSLTTSPFNDPPRIGAITAVTVGALLSAEVIDPENPANNKPAVFQVDEDETVTIHIAFSDPETANDKLILAINSYDENVINRLSMTWVLSGNGIDLTIKPRPDQNKEAPGVKMEFTVSDGEKMANKSFQLIVNPMPDAPRTPDWEMTVRDASYLYFNPLEYAYDPDAGDVISLESLIPAGGFTLVAGGKIYKGAEFIGTLTGSGENWTFISEPGIKGAIPLKYTVKDNTPVVDDGPLYSTGTITINVTDSQIGPSLDRIPVIHAFMNQVLPAYPLIVRNVDEHMAYILRAELVSGDGVVSTSIKIDGNDGSLGVTDAATSPQSHALTFELAPDKQGESFIRVTINCGPDEDSIIVRVVVTDENEPPVAKDYYASVHEGGSDSLKVLDPAHVSDREDPYNQFLKISEIVSTSGGVATIETDANGIQYIRYTAGSPYNAHTSPNQEEIKYIIVDGGGAKNVMIDGESGLPIENPATAYIDVTSTNHGPVANLRVIYIDQDAARAAFTVDPLASTYDYDKDTIYLYDLTPDASREAPGSLDYILFTETTNSHEVDVKTITFTAPTDGNSDPIPGWYDYTYYVMSNFHEPENSTCHCEEGSHPSDWNQDKYWNKTSGQLWIGVRDKNGDIPPRIVSNWTEVDEDYLYVKGRTYTQHDFGDGLENAIRWRATQVYAAMPEKGAIVDFKTEVTTTNPTNYLKLDDWDIEIEKESGYWYLVIYYKPAKDANTAIDGGTSNRSDPIVFNVRVGQDFTLPGETEPQDTVWSTPANETIYITPVPDPPVIEEIWFFDKDKQKVTYNGSHPLPAIRGDYVDFFVFVTDADYKVQENADKQINLIAGSTNALFVNPNQTIITAPYEENGSGIPGVWKVSVRGINKTDIDNITDEELLKEFLENLGHLDSLDDFLKRCFLYITATDRDGTTDTVGKYKTDTNGDPILDDKELVSVKGNKLNTLLPVYIIGGNHKPVARNYQTIFDEDTKAFEAVYIDSIYLNEASDIDGDVLTIWIKDPKTGIFVCSRGNVDCNPSAVFEYPEGTARIEGNKITFQPNADFYHNVIYTKTNPGGVWTDTRQFISVTYKLSDGHLLSETVGWETGMTDGPSESDEATVFFHFNPVNDPPRFSFQTDQTMMEGEKGLIRLTVYDPDGDIDKLYAANFDVSRKDDPKNKIQSVVVKSVTPRIVEGIWTGYYDVVIEVEGVPYQCHEGDDLPSVISVTVTDGAGASAHADINLTIIPANDLPMLNPPAGKDYGKLETSGPGSGIPLSVTLDGNNRLEVYEDGTLTIDIRKYFIDHDDDTMHLLSFESLGHGTVANNDDNIVFTPTKDFYTAYADEVEVADSRYGMLRYMLTDGTGTVTGTIRIFIIPVNDAPNPLNVEYRTDEDKWIETIDLYQYKTKDQYHYNPSTDPIGQTGNGGRVIWDIDNQYGDLKITSIGSSLTPADIEAFKKWDLRDVLDSGMNQDDIKADVVAATMKGKTAGGGIVWMTNGDENKIIHYIPFPDYNGSDNFVYHVLDVDLTGAGEHKTSTATVSIYVSALDDPPRVNFQASETWTNDPSSRVEIGEGDIPVWVFYEDAPNATFNFRMWDPEGAPMSYTFDIVAGSAKDADGNSISSDTLIVKSNISTGGTTASRSLTFKPQPNAYGEFRLRFVFSDGGKQNTQDVIVRILPVNDAPAISGGIFNLTVYEGSNSSNPQNSVSLSATDIEKNINDGETPGLKFSGPFPEDASHSGPLHGTVTVTSNGRYTYVPNPHYFGDDYFWVAVTDRGWAGDGRLNLDDPMNKFNPDNTINPEAPIPPWNDAITTYAMINVKVVPQNDPPSHPGDIIVSQEGEYKSATDKIFFTGTKNLGLTVTWLPGKDYEDDPEYETRPENLLYDIQLFNGTSWVTVASEIKGDKQGTRLSWTIPATRTEGLSIDTLQVRMRTWDDGMSYIKIDDVYVPEGDKLANKNSGEGNEGPWALSATYNIDSAAPGAAHILTKDVWTNDAMVTITITPNDLTPNQLWQSGVKVDSLEKTGDSIADTDLEYVEESGGVYSFKVARNGDYYFTIVDNVGNIGTYKVTVTNLDRVYPTITNATPALFTNIYSNSAAADRTVRLTYTDQKGAINPGDPEGKRDGASEFASGGRQYFVSQSSGLTAAGITGWSNYTDGVVLNGGKGSWYIYAKAVDQAGNETYEKFGPYVILNSPPALEEYQGAKVYEHNIEEVTANKSAVSIDLKTKTVDYDGDTLKYTWVDTSTIQDWGELTLGENNGIITFTAGNFEFEKITSPSDRKFTLQYQVTDNDPTPEFSRQRIIIELIPVNQHPTEPVIGTVSGGIAEDGKRFYKSTPSNNVTFTFTEGSDKHEGNTEETAQSALKYNVEYTTDGTIWTPLATAAVAADATGGYSFPVPAVTNGTDKFQFRIRTNDGNATSGKFVDIKTGTVIDGVSEWVNSVVMNIDNTAPGITHTAEKPSGEWTNQEVKLTINVDNGTEAWQSAYDNFVRTDTVANISAPVVTTKDTHTQTYTYKVTGNGTYAFKATDAIGNERTYQVIVNNIDMDAPKIEIDIPKAENAPGEYSSPVGITLTYADEKVTSYYGVSGVNERQYKKATVVEVVTADDDEETVIPTNWIKVEVDDDKYLVIPKEWKDYTTIKVDGDKYIVIPNGWSDYTTKKFAEDKYLVIPNEWSSYTAPLDLREKGEYYIYGRVTDNAGNVTVYDDADDDVDDNGNLAHFTIINNAPTEPDPEHNFGKAYEHDIDVDGDDVLEFSRKVRIELTVEDIDNNDPVTFRWITEWIDDVDSILSSTQKEDMKTLFSDEYDETKDALENLSGYGTLEWVRTRSLYTAAVTFEVKKEGGVELETIDPADRVFKLTYVAYDNDEEHAYTTGTVTIKLVPVNHRPTQPGGPITPAAAGQFYKKDDTIALTWASSSDREDVPEDLKYEIQYTLVSAPEEGDWTSVATNVSGTDTGKVTYSAAAPEGNSAVLHYRIRAIDTNPAVTGYIDEQTGTEIPGISEWTIGPFYNLDNTVPDVTSVVVEYDPDSDDEHPGVIVTVTLNDGNDPWQSGFDSIIIDPPLLTCENKGGGVYVCKGPGNKDYKFEFKDNAGNVNERTVHTTLPGVPTISYTPLPTCACFGGDDVHVTWTAASDAAYYELEYWDDPDGDDVGVWRLITGPKTVSGVSGVFTSLSYDFTIQKGFADRDNLKFRVRAANASGLRNVWAESDDVLVDSTPPKIVKAVASPTVWTNGNVTVSLAIEENLSGIVKIVINSYDGTVTSTPLRILSYPETFFTLEQNGDFEVKVTDLCGNEAEATLHITNIDKSRPEFTVEVTTGGVIYTEPSNKPLDFTIKFSDPGVSGLATREYIISTDNNTDLEGPVSGWIQTSDDTVTFKKTTVGIYYVYMRATDKAGNSHYEKFGPYERFDTPPIAQDKTVTVYAGETITDALFATDVDDGDSITEWEVETQPVYGVLTLNNDGTFTYEHDGAGTITATDSFTYKVKDMRNEWSNIATVTINIK